MTVVVLGVSNGSPYFKTYFTKDNEAFIILVFHIRGAGTGKITLLRALKGATVPDAGYQINLTELVGGKSLETAMELYW